MSSSTTLGSVLSAGLSRRRFLGVAATAAAATVAAPRLAFASPAAGGSASSNHVVVLLFLRGGADGLSLVAPFTMGSYHDLRPTISIKGPGAGGGALPLVSTATIAPFELDGVFGMHPRLSRLHDTAWANGDLAIVHAAGMPSVESSTRSHFESMRNWESGSASLSVAGGFMNRYLAAIGATTGITGVSNGTGLARSLAGPVGTYAVANPAAAAIAGFGDSTIARSVLNSWYVGGADLVQASGRNAIDAVDTLRSINWNAPALQPHNGASYPNTQLGTDLREVAQLIRSNAGLRVAAVDCGSWDTHEGMVSQSGISWFDRMVSDLGDSLSAFYTDLGTDMDRVTLATMSEFGRTINENGSGGTDHGRGSVMFVMGKNLRGGIHGDFVDHISDGPEGDLVVLNDYRRVIGEVLATRGGLASLNTVFPTSTPTNFLGICAP